MSNECTYCLTFPSVWYGLHSSFWSPTSTTKFQTEPLSGVVKYTGVGMRFLTEISVYLETWKQYEVGPWLQWLTNTKS